MDNEHSIDEENQQTGIEAEINEDLPQQFAEVPGSDTDAGSDGDMDGESGSVGLKTGDGPVKVSRMKGREAKRRWYIVHTYSGHENKVKVNLERRIESMNMGHKIFRVEVPQKQVTKIKDGKRIERDERVFPGYVLVEMLMDDDSWYVVRYTPGVTKFVGGDKKPIPAKDSEIKRILLKTAPTKTTKVEIDLKVGETIRITSGPFADFEGTVTEVDGNKEKLKASVSIFGRETPVELVFNQVEKV